MEVDPEKVRRLVAEKSVERPTTAKGPLEVPGIQDLPIEYHFYRPTTTGDLNINTNFLDNANLPHAFTWNRCLANTLTELAATRWYDPTCSGRFFYVPDSPAEGRGTTASPSPGPQIVAVPHVWSEKGMQSMMAMKPIERDFELNINFRADILDSQPVLPIYCTPTPLLRLKEDPLSRPMVGGRPLDLHEPFYNRRDISCVASHGSGTLPGLFVETVYGAHHLFTVQQMFGPAGIWPTSTDVDSYYVVPGEPFTSNRVPKIDQARNMAFLEANKIVAPDPQLELLRAINRFWKDENNIEAHLASYHWARSFSW
ncbi:hypothetical protein LTR27_012359 [Elasticomyces elasticus]|nr:hypothetical protein LTR27_012359 [Elasticomyces elasticus]